MNFEKIKFVVFYPMLRFIAAGVKPLGPKS